jgi:hypothetical protein
VYVYVLIKELLVMQIYSTLSVGKRRRKKKERRRGEKWRMEMEADGVR